jgi:hypothetical protein
VIIFRDLVYSAKLTFNFAADECRKTARGLYEISVGNDLDNVVGVDDFYLLEICTSPKFQVGNVRSYHSWHYNCHGVNVQAVSDHLSRLGLFCSC